MLTGITVLHVYVFAYVSRMKIQSAINTLKVIFMFTQMFTELYCTSLCPVVVLATYSNCVILILMIKLIM